MGIEKKIILLLGGARSGKSSFAQELAKKLAAKVLFVATASAGDEDMRQRIQKHRQGRPASWRTLEASDHLGHQIEEHIGDAQLVVIDCITLLVNNLFGHYDEKQFETLDDSILEQQVAEEIGELQACLKNLGASFIIVSNELGLGVVPDNRTARLFRDILGRTNQRLAQSADEVYLMVAGIPLQLKPARG